MPVGLGHTGFQVHGDKVYFAHWTPVEDMPGKVRFYVDRAVSNEGVPALLCEPVDLVTPVELRTHTTDPVPYLLVDSERDGPGGTYSEPATAGCDPVPGHEMLSRLLSR